MTSTTTLITMLTIMMSINIALTMFQGSILDINPNTSIFFNTENSSLSKYADLDNSKLLQDHTSLPSNLAVDEDSTNSFSDIWRFMSGWVKDKLSPLSFLADIFSQPAGFLNDIQLPQPIPLFVGVLWYLVILILMVSWWGGR